MFRLKVRVDDPKRQYRAHPEEIEFEGELVDYSAAELFMSIVCKCGWKGDRRFEVATSVLYFLFQKEESRLKKIEEGETGNNWTSSKFAIYKDPQTQNEWFVCFDVGSGLHGHTGVDFSYTWYDYKLRGNSYLETYEEGCEREHLRRELFGESEAINELARFAEEDGFWDCHYGRKRNDGN